MESIRPFNSYKHFLEQKFHRPILGKCQTEQSALAGNYNRFIQTSSHTYPYHVLRPRYESASQSQGTLPKERITELNMNQNLISLVFTHCC